MSLFLDRLAASWPPDSWRDLNAVVAVSGGADSVALLAGLAALKRSGSGKLIAAHFNHEMRGADSDEDEAFVRRLAEQLALSSHAGRSPGGPTAWDTRDGFEAAARTARYEFLTDVARQTGARYVAVAHTADDQAETVLHRILRGTGIAGLAGMPRVRSLAPAITLIRPLLAFRRDDVRAYLRETGQKWREDASNANLDWTRNRIRGELLPHLEREYNPAVIEALLRLGELARDAQQVIDGETEKLLERTVTEALPQQAVIDMAPLRRCPEYLLCEFFIALWRRQGWPRQHYGRDEWRRLAAMVNQPGSAEATVTFPGAIVALRQKDVLTLLRTGTDQA